MRGMLSRVFGGENSSTPRPGPNSPHGPYFLQVGQPHSGSMGPKSFWNCFFFSCRFPVGTKAEPKRCMGRVLDAIHPHTLTSPLIAPPRASPLSSWGKRSRTCHIRGPHRPPSRWHNCKGEWGLSQGSLSSLLFTSIAPPPPVQGNASTPSGPLDGLSMLSPTSPSSEILLAPSFLPTRPP